MKVKLCIFFKKLKRYQFKLVKKKKNPIQRNNKVSLPTQKQSLPTTYS